MSVEGAAAGKRLHLFLCASPKGFYSLSTG